MNGSKTEGVAGVEEECGRQPQAVTHSYSRSTICAENMSHTNTHTHRERRPLALVMVMYSRRHGMPTHRSDNLVARRRRKRKVVLCGVPVSSLVLESVLRNEDGKFQLSAVAEDVPMRLYKFFSMLWCFLLHVGTINCHCVRRDRSTNIHATHELCMILVVLVKSALDYALGDTCKCVCVNRLGCIAIKGFLLKIPIRKFWLDRR